MNHLILKESVTQEQLIEKGFEIDRPGYGAFRKGTPQSKDIYIPLRESSVLVTRKIYHNENDGPVQLDEIADLVDAGMVEVLE